MCNRRSLLAVFVSAALASPVFASPAQAGGDATAFRCGTDLLKLGEVKFSAVQKCGEPAAKDSFCKAGPVPTSTTCETVDEWTYNPGYGQFVTTLRFESGRLVSIVYGGRSR